LYRHGNLRWPISYQPHAKIVVLSFAGNTQVDEGDNMLLSFRFTQLCGNLTPI
jgi:hypothetical protein